MTGTAAAPPRGKIASLLTPFRILSSLLLAFAAFCLVLAFQGAADPAVEVNLRPAAVISVFPSEDAKVLRQERIGARLADGFTGELEIDGVSIPLDQLQRPQDPLGSDAGTAAAKGLAGLNEVSFTPGAGQEIEKMRPGDHTAKLLFWDRVASSREKADTYSWTFSVT
jgi:hypothetical protein